jgi:hypothetical protein
MQSRFEHRDKFRPGILYAVPRRAKPANRLGQIGPVIKIDQPFFEIAIFEVALYFGWLQRFEMHRKFSGVVGLYGEPTLMAP